MCGMQLKDRERSIDLMLMLHLNELIDELAIANSVCWYGHVLMGEDGYVLGTLDSEIDDQRKKGKLKRWWKKQVG